MDYDKLIEQHYTNLFWYARKVCRNLEEAEDILHDVLANIVRTKNVKEEKSFVAYARVAIKRTLYNKTARKKPLDFVDTLSYIEDNSIENNSLEKQEEYEQYKHIPDDTPGFFRETFEKFYLEHKEIKTISREQNIPVGTVKRRLNNSRKACKKYLSSI